MTMRKAGKFKRSRRRSGPRTPVLDRLKPEESETVLRRILAAHPDVVRETEGIARALLEEGADFEGVACEVQDAVESFDIEALNGRAGRHAGRYVGPTEAAWEILQESVAPFLEDMKRLMELGLEAQALEICKGVVLGLYRVEQAKGGDLAEWAPDFPSEEAANVLEAWCKGCDRTKKPAGAVGRRHGRAFPLEFVSQFVPEWREMIPRILSGKVGE